jgi:NitT/TauT family transport system ATP-binding protein
MLATRILRLSGPSASIIEDVPVPLSVADRLNRDKVQAEQRRIFGNR